jgi:hypothetical protein
MTGQGKHRESDQKDDGHKKDDRSDKSSSMIGQLSSSNSMFSGKRPMKNYFSRTNHSTSSQLEKSHQNQ